MNFNQAGGTNAAYFPDMMLFQKDPPLPGYNQVTNLNQINRLTDKTKFLVVAEGETGLYALYPRLSPNVTAGGLPTPAGTYGLRCARLTVNGQTVTAAAAASHGAATLDTSITDISNLHLTITPGTGSTYQFISTATPTVKFNLGGNGMFASDAGNLTVTITGGELSVFNSSASRYLSFSESGSTHYNWTGCGSDFWGPTAKTGAPLYLFYQASCQMNRAWPWPACSPATRSATPIPKAPITIPAARTPGCLPAAAPPRAALPMWRVRALGRAL